MQHDDTGVQRRDSAAVGLPPRPYTLRVLSEQPAQLSEHTLACVTHGVSQAPSADPRHIHVDLALLSGAGVELWESALPVQHGWDNGIGYAENGTVLFGQVRIEEAALEPTEAAAFEVYRRIDAFLKSRGYPACLRIWNFLAHINHGSSDMERYRQFSLGRYRALATPGFEASLPAATAIGSHEGGVLIYFLAGRQGGQQIENPRQVSAFRYPRQYGPSSPSFSRAVLLPWPDHAELLVSGTASVVGHETWHVGEPLRQLEESVANVQALLGQLSSHPGISHLQWRPDVVKLYLRDPALLAAAEAQLRTALPAGTPVMALAGDICRTELDLEIEALYTSVST